MKLDKFQKYTSKLTEITTFKIKNHSKGWLDLITANLPPNLDIG